MSWKPEFKDGSGKDDWCRNGCTFATELEAKKYANDLMGRWFGATASQVVEVDSIQFPVTYAWQETVDEKGHTVGHARPIDSISPMIYPRDFPA